MPAKPNAEPTRRQTEILEWIKKFISTKSYAPTVREIGAGVGISSPNGVVSQLAALRKKGLIRQPRRPDGRRLTRTIEIVGAEQELRIPFSAAELESIKGTAKFAGVTVAVWARQILCSQAKERPRHG